MDTQSIDKRRFKWAVVFLASLVSAVLSACFLPIFGIVPVFTAGFALLCFIDDTARYYMLLASKKAV